MWGESYKSCLLDNVCDMILSSKVYPAFFDRSERALNTHARLDELLHERNMTLYQLCQSGNIPYTTLRVSRCRGSQLSVDTIEQICRVLGISMAEFFTVHAEATMGVPLERIPERAAVAQALGADYICVHTSLDVPDAPDPLESMRLARQGAPELKLAVAGGINLQTLPRIIAAKPDLIIVGGAICKAVDPIETAKTMKKMILEEAIQ